jgi:hypothetical protein
MNRPISISIVLLALLGACSSPKAPTPQVASSPAVAPAPVEPVIVRLVGRDKTITISAGPGHTLYSAIDAAGKTIVSKATLDELKISHPDLYQRVSPGVTAYAGL